MVNIRRLPRIPWAAGSHVLRAASARRRPAECPNHPNNRKFTHHGTPLHGRRQRALGRPKADQPESSLILWWRRSCVPPATTTAATTPVQPAPWMRNAATRNRRRHPPLRRASERMHSGETDVILGTALSLTATGCQPSTLTAPPKPAPSPTSASGAITADRRRKQSRRQTVQHPADAATLPADTDASASTSKGRRQPAGTAGRIGRRRQRFTATFWPSHHHRNPISTTMQPGWDPARPHPPANPRRCHPRLRGVKPERTWLRPGPTPSGSRPRQAGRQLVAEQNHSQPSPNPQPTRGQHVAGTQPNPKQQQPRPNQAGAAGLFITPTS